MPRNSLRNIAAATPPSGQPDPPPLPHEVRTLLAERDALQARMSALTGGSVTSEENRFPVTPLTQRRAEDDAWARRRDALSPVAAASPPEPDRKTGTLADEPDLAQRTGQRALQDREGRFADDVPPGLRERLGRFGEDTPPGLRDRIDRLADSMPPPMRLPDPAPLKERSLRMRDRPLRNDPGLRDFAPQIPVPKVPELREITDRFSGPAKRLDILSGGSGDLDELRQTASERLKARRAEERREARQTARRKAAREEQKREGRRTGKRGKYD